MGRRICTMVDYWEPWQPKLADRVRVRPSGECQAFRPSMYLVTDPSNAREIWSRSGAILGHLASERLISGYVSATNGDLLEIPKGHRYLVHFDDPIRLVDDLDHTAACGWYAAAELEKLAENVLSPA